MTMNNNIALKLNQVDFKFSEENPFFFYNVSVSFPAQKIHFIRGQNGAGKSTLFKILQGRLEQKEIIAGSIELHGARHNFSEARVASFVGQIKLVQQKFDLMLADRFSFIENLRCANIGVHPNFTRLPDHQPLPAFIARFCINHDVPVKMLSGGQRQMLAILMALQKPTKVLLLDEPTAALDEQNAKMVMQFLDELVKATGITVLIICHDREIVETYASEGYYEIVVDEKTKLRSLVLRHSRDSLLPN
jgi:ABC-type bacteriocin/lantibiotic exporter with double-glycine peptidase domain